MKFLFRFLTGRAPATPQLIRSNVDVTCPLEIGRCNFDILMPARPTWTAIAIRLGEGIPCSIRWDADGMLGYQNNWCIVSGNSVVAYRSPDNVFYAWQATNWIAVTEDLPVTVASV